MLTVFHIKGSISRYIMNLIRDWIYVNRSKSQIGSYEIIDFKHYNREHANETYTKGRPFHCV